MGSLRDELDHRARDGDHPMSIGALAGAFRAIGYTLDRSLDCRCMSKWMTGPRAGQSYPCVTTGIREIDTGLSAFHVSARRDTRFDKLQEMRLSGKYFAVSKGALLEP
ncbi:hypothetical protein [Sphingomonas oryzagri]